MYNSSFFNIGADMYFTLRLAVVIDSLLFAIFGFLGYTFVTTSESRLFLNFHQSLFNFAFFLLAMFVSSIIFSTLKLPEYKESHWNIGCSYFFGAVVCILFGSELNATSLGLLMFGFIVYVLFLLNRINDAVKNTEDLP
jgi:hypothetical protein